MSSRSSIWELEWLRLSALDLQASHQSVFQGLKEVLQSKVHRTWRRHEGAGAWSLVELWWGPTFPPAHWFLPEEHPVPLQLGSLSSHILQEIQVPLE